MKKNNKNTRNRLLLGLSLTALMAAGGAMTALAAEEGWVAHGNDWYYVDKYGDYVEYAWKYNAAGTEKFYLGEDGRMVTNGFVEDNNGLYYVNDDGVQSRDRWRLLETEDDEEARWYYFGSDGKAYENGWKTIDGKKYHFTNYRMDYGFLDANGQMLDTDHDDIWKSAVYYMGTSDEGWRRDSYWLQLRDIEDSSYRDYDGIWLWFDNLGQKSASETDMINGSRYTFDANGAMMVGWYGTDPTNADYKYYNEDDGMERGDWFRVVPSEAQDAEDYDNQIRRWFYANNSGETYKDTIRSIDNDRYIFDAHGIMRTGLIVVNADNTIYDILGDPDHGEQPTSDEIIAARANGTLMYFNKDGDLLENGKINLELEDGSFTLKFDKSGKALHGAQDGYLYNNGILIEAGRDDSGYKYEVIRQDSRDYLVNTSGKIMKAGTYRDGNVKWTVTESGGSYSISVDYN